MSVVAGKFDPKNPVAYYAAVRARLTTPQKKPSPLLVVHDTRHTQPIINLPQFLPKRDAVTAEKLFDPVAAQIAWVHSADRLLRCERMRDDTKPRYTVQEVRRFIADRSGVALIDIDSARRTAYLVLPRQVGMWLCKRATVSSLPEIGRRFGGRDHTTVLYAARKIEALHKAGALPDWAMQLAAQLIR